ncbi:hypothetical protein VTJ49DRAFT_5804 [Mycothermus thermophilus]|uniref:Zinc finger PHD-type domain-containing protein n=1 Tax=Humicola insolens TaxID=85995 RepID=A0ABR3VRJ2_HUMIN
MLTDGSFGDSTAQPPTPQRTPVSTALPSPIFETPKPTHRRHESTGWTPRFAEEYSVFNATPGNLRGCQAPYPDFGPPTPFSGDTDERRPSSVDGIGLGVGVPANELSPAPSLSLPSVEPSKVPRSSPNPLRTPTLDRTSPAANTVSEPAERSAKKPRRGTITADPQGQTATPPPSSHKGERKLAPKPSTMQNDQDYGAQAHFVPPTPQLSTGSFVASQNDLFGYPLSAPATAPYGAHRSFWDADPGLAGMDIDFGAGSAGVFPNPVLHQVSGSVDWTAAAQLLPSPGGLAPNGNAHTSGTDGHAATLVSQPPMSMLVTSSADTSMLGPSFAAPLENGFGISDANGGVNPGLLFSRPQTAVDTSVSFSQAMPPLSSTAPAPVSQDHVVPDRGMPMPKASGKVELRRSASAKDSMPRKQDRTLASSPVKESGRPGLTRSFSEHRGKKATVNRPSLPPLAPRPRSQLVSNAGVNANKPVVSQPQRPSSGRSSPPKSSHSQHHPNHNRLSSLSSIPELQGPEMRTQATFMIDANGRARVETTVVVVDGEPRNGATKRVSSYSVASRHSGWDSDNDSSSTDDEPIIIPSRSTSFALPDPRKPTTIHPFSSHHQPQRSMSERSITTSSSYKSFQGVPRQAAEADSDGEGVADDHDTTPTRRPSGDALSELRKLRETRQKQAAAAASAKQQSRRYVVPSQYPRHPSTSSPTTLSESSLPTPTDSRGSRNIRCVCHRAEAGRGDFLVKCESCEMYVHGSCVSITERTMPSIYICAFCSDLPNVNGGRPRESGSFSGQAGPPGPLGSPLARKSLKSFRTDPGLDRENAIYRRFTQRGGHPGLRCYCGPVSGGGIRLEYAPNGCVRRFLTDCTQEMPVNSAAADVAELRRQWAIQIAEAMVFVHAAGVVHGALESNTVLLDREMRARVMYFRDSSMDGEALRGEARKSHRYPGKRVSPLYVPTSWEGRDS